LLRMSSSGMAKIVLMGIKDEVRKDVKCGACGLILAALRDGVRD